MRELGGSKPPSTIVVALRTMLCGRLRALPGRSEGALLLRRSCLEPGHAHEVVGRGGELQPATVALQMITKRSLRPPPTRASPSRRPAPRSLRRRWLCAYPACRVLRPSTALRRRLSFWATCLRVTPRARLRAPKHEVRGRVVAAVGPSVAPADAQAVEHRAALPRARRSRSPGSTRRPAPGRGGSR